MSLLSRWLRLWVYMYWWRRANALGDGTDTGSTGMESSVPRDEWRACDGGSGGSIAQWDARVRECTARSIGASLPDPFELETANTCVGKTGDADDFGERICRLMWEGRRDEEALFNASDTQDSPLSIL